MHEEACGRRRHPAVARQIERPAGPAEPGADIGLEALVVLRGKVPAGDVGAQKFLHLRRVGDGFDVDLLGLAGREPGRTDQRRMEARMGVSEPRHLAGERGVEVARDHLEARERAVLAIPGIDRRDVPLIAGAQPDDAIERVRGKLLRHQRRDAIVDLAVRDADRIARNTLEHLHARDRVGDIGVDDALDRLRRGDG